MEIKAHVLDQYTRQVDALTPAQQRRELIGYRYLLHEALHTLQLARDGHSTFRSDTELLDYLTSLLWIKPAEVMDMPRRALPDVSHITSTRYGTPRKKNDE